MEGPIWPRVPFVNSPGNILKKNTNKIQIFNFSGPSSSTRTAGFGLPFSTLKMF